MQRLAKLFALPARTLLTLALGAAIGGVATSLVAQGRQAERTPPLPQLVTLVQLTTRSFSSGWEYVQRFDDSTRRVTCYVVVADSRASRTLQAAPSCLKY